MTLRDPETGRQTRRKLGITISAAGRTLPQHIEADDWAAAAAYLTSPEFQRIADTAEHVTITNREF